MLSCQRDVIKTHCCIATTQCWLNQNSERVYHPDCFARGLDTLMIPLFCNSYIILISILYPSCQSEKKKRFKTGLYYGPFELYVILCK